MLKPVCSVVIPTRNCREYLPTALSSVAMQRCHNLEVIVVDDGSDDGTAGWLKRHVDDYPRLRIIETSGIGPAKARNAAIQMASASLIAFLDVDDWWWPHKLAEQVRYHAANPEIAFSFTDYLHVSTDGKSRGSCFEFWKPKFTRSENTNYFELGDALNVILAANLVGTSTVVASKAALEEAGCFAYHGSAEDWELWLRLAARYPVACTNSITATYLIRPGSVSSKQAARISAMSKIISHYESSGEVSVRQAAAKARARLDVARAELARSAGRHISAGYYHSRAFMTLPSVRLGKEVAASFFDAAFPHARAERPGR